MNQFTAHAHNPITPLRATMWAIEDGRRVSKELLPLSFSLMPRVLLKYPKNSIIISGLLKRI